MQIRHALQQAQTRLTQSDSARLDAEILLMQVLNKPRSYLFTWPEVSLNQEQYTAFERLIEQRAKGMPVAYLIGYREFWGMALKVTADTLIPRPETELLVELALALLAPHQAFKVLDLGTGTGAIALAIAKERPQAQVLAVDSSPAALAVAQDNANQLGLTTIQFLQSDWFSAIPKQAFDLIMSNPPYIPDQDPHLQQGDVRFEPRSALSSGHDGLNALRTICRNAPQFLAPHAWLLLEHGYDQGRAVTDLLRHTGFQKVTCHKDLAGQDRVSSGQFIPSPVEA
ncbi:peptide chain release factor N(5)-glutamine methyltransferase [Thiolinea disciformis]|uniref:peptide chain release factor N(5)-glutamine methyltransferase n=1 Tax=Thiolinea disciformis TaxID=125614 RepID=UPI000372EDE3|nr:peptide chain release factor N(5)-glutamine methyltransferase [Thiolinea disciformis]